MQDKCQIVQDFPKLHFIGKFDIFLLISLSDIVSIIGLTLLLENIGQCDITWWHLIQKKQHLSCNCVILRQSTNKGGQINFSVIRSCTIIELQALWIDINIESTGIQWIWEIWCHSLALSLKSTTIWSCKFSCMVIRCPTYFMFFFSSPCQSKVSFCHHLASIVS